MSNMTDTEAAYLAGLLEGEGCFDFNAMNVKYPRIRLEMCDEDVVLRAQSLLGGKVYRREGKKTQHSPTFLLIVNGRDKVKPALESVLPLMGVRRSAKIRELLSSYVD